MKRSLIALALAALLPLSASAAETSYTYIEGDYVSFDGDADGFGLRGSVNFGESNFYAFGSYANAEIDNTNFDVDFSDVGLGYHHALSDKADLLAELAYVNADLGPVDADGYRVSVGVRGQMAERFEGLFKANYIDGDNFDGDFTATLGGQFHINQVWGITGEVEVGDGGETYLVGVRASF